MFRRHWKLWLMLVGLAGGLVGYWAYGRVQPEEDCWLVVYMDGVKAGHSYVATYAGQINTQPCQRVDQLTRLKIGRSQNAIVEMEHDSSSWVSPAGQLLKFNEEERSSSGVSKTSGVVQGDKLTLTSIIGGRTASRDIPWSPDYGSFDAIGISLKQRPMKPGEQRTLQMFMPTVHIVATVDLTARDYESTPLLSGSARLFRIDCKTTMPKIEPQFSTYWFDALGELAKMHENTMKIDMYVVSKAEALSDTGEAPPDLGDATLVKLATPIADPHRTTEVRYRVEVAEGDPARLFLSDALQEVKSTGEHTAEITVHARRPWEKAAPVNTEQPADAEKPATGDSPPTDAERRPSGVLQSDDPRVVALAREAAGDEQDPVRVAMRLESFVHNRINVKNFSQAFATAGDVAKSLEGDCTEHAVLLAAMARARGIPSRGVMGLIYVHGPGQPPAFGYHMWTELYLNGHWVPFDGTLGLGGIGAAHLKLGQSSLGSDNSFTEFMAVAQVLGQLKIEVLSFR